MVHPITARFEDRMGAAQHPIVRLNDGLCAEPNGLIRYVLVADSLIRTYAHDPLAVGVYVAIARLTLAAKDAVPLAARDLVAWMGSDRDADRAAIMRRIAKLEKDGWLIAERAVATKHRLTPTWGRDQSGTPRPWRFDAADSGRPYHVLGAGCRLPCSTITWAGSSPSLVTGGRSSAAT